MGKKEVLGLKIIWGSLQDNANNSETLLAQVMAPRKSTLQNNKVKKMFLIGSDGYEPVNY